MEHQVSHTIREKTKLLNRVRRIRGQVEAVERALEEEIGRPVLWAGPRVLLGKNLLWKGELDSAVALFEAALADAVRARNERLRSYRLYDLALANCLAGIACTE